MRVGPSRKFSPLPGSAASSAPGCYSSGGITQQWAPLRRLPHSQAAVGVWLSGLPRIPRAGGEGTACPWIAAAGVLGGLKLPAAAVGRGQPGLWVWLGEQGRMMRGKKPGLVGDQILSSLSDSEAGPALHRPFPGTNPCCHKHRLLLAPRAGAGGWDRSPVPTSHCHT